MALRADVPVPGASVHLRFTDRTDGDLATSGHVVPGDLAARRAAVAPGAWTWLRQVHGADVVVVAAPGERAGEPADAAVTDVPGAVLAVHTADCAGVLLWDAAGTAGGRGPVVAACHAGWRGLDAGVLQATVAAMRGLGAERPTWWLGPCISPERYEFGSDDLAALVDRLGPEVAATTADGAPALDLRAGVAAALAEAGAAPWTEDVPPCTAGDDRWFSWRARGEPGRQAAVVWSGPAGAAP